MLEANEITVAIIHSSIEVGNRARNIAKIERIIERLSRSIGIDLIVIPQMINGVLLYNYPITTKRIRRVAEGIPGRTTQEMGAIANKYGKNLLVGPILERRGAKLYRSAFLVIPILGIKGVIRQLEPFGGSNIEMPLLNMDKFRVGILIAEDILYPEISLLLNLMSIDVLIFYPTLDMNLNKQRQFVIMRAIESRCTGVMIGGTITRRGEALIDIPTIAVDENGDVIEELIGVEDKVLLVKASVKTDRGFITHHRKNVLVKLRKLLLFYFTK